MSKIILDLCGGTGAWSKPYEEEYIVINITLPFYDLLKTKFGDPYTKKTDLWGYFNLPKKNNIVEPRFTKRFKSGNRMSYFHYLTTLKPPREAKRLRAITPAGFTKAFFEANR